MADDERTTIAREGLQRTKPFTLARAGDGEGGDGLTLEGHAAVFGQKTLIDSWEGRFWEDIARGAFKRTFNALTPVLQFDHGRHPLVGSIPIGRINTAKEDEVGAYTKARLHDNWLVQPVRDAIASKSISGMSFRFSVVREEWRTPDGKLLTDPKQILQGIYQASSDDDQLLTRTLRELKVPEMGPVVFPAYSGTDVGVRSGTTVIDLGRLRQDPDERKKLARALWIAEQPAQDVDQADQADEQRDGGTDDGDEQAPDAVAAIRQVGQQISDALAGLAELLTTGGKRTDAPATEDEPPSDDDERADSQTSDSAGDGHSDDSASTDGHADPAPASRHAGEHDDPPSEEGHSSDDTAPRRMSRTGRRLALAAIEQQWEFQQERTGLFGHLFDRDDADDQDTPHNSDKEN